MLTVTDSQSRVAPLYIRVFGGMGLDDAGEPTSIGGPRQQKLLALLAVRAGSVVDIDWLAEYLWTDADRPEATAPALRTYVSRLRGVFPEEAQAWIETVPSGYRLAAPEAAVEHLRFASLRAAAKEARDRNDPLVAQELLDEALGLWRGAPFRELEDVEWARAHIDQLELDRLEMLEERWETALALGRHTQITGELATFTSEHGLRDRAARQYALALHRSGRTPEALRVLGNHRRTVAEETGLDPSPAVVELEQALLTGDSSLDAEATGRPLRGYRLVEEAGVGAFAIVWRGIQPSVNREVAIKQIRSELASQPEFIRRFEAEAHLVARIEHPHIVPLIDFWRDPDSAYLVMRWFRGGTLEQRLDDGPLSLPETLVLAHQIGGALSAAHGHGVIHRDVKTGNILFDEAGHAFLGDFGIALEATESAGPEAALSPGSPAYSAPEQIRREPLGPEADVFSLGVVLFECLTGSLPFGAMAAQDLVERQLNEPYPSLAELRADVPASVSDAVAKATAKDPSDRFESIAAFVDALEPAAAALDVAVEPITGEVSNPYNGLQAFDDGDTDRFFGRERLVNELVGRLSSDTIQSRCVAVVGPSGSGKSSVVRAGLVPAIHAGRVPGSDEWFTTTMVPGGDPFESLEVALLRIAVNPPTTLLDQLRDGSRGILRSVGRCLPSDGDRLVLVIDQFEEVFAGASAATADEFLAALAVAVSEPTSRLRLVITLRADYYDRPLAHPTFAGVLKETAVDVTPLAPDELEQAIVEPARRQGVTFEPGLVAHIAAEANGQPSPLPLLQYALSELFDRRVGNQLTAEAYREMGGLSGALAARAEAIHTEADADQRAALRRIFGRMTDPSTDSADLRRRVPLADFGDDTASVWVLGQLDRARLVTFDRDVTTREPTVEVAHEALLREWPRLADWLREDNAMLQAVDDLDRAAGIWDAGGRADPDLYRGGRLETALGLTSAAGERLRPIDTEFVDASQTAAKAERRAEAGRVKRLRRLVVAVGAALVIALIAGGIAFNQQRRADDEAAAARAAAAEAEAQTLLAQDSATEAEAQTLLAQDSATEAEAQTAVAVAAAESAELATIISRSAASVRDDPEVALLLALEANRRTPAAETEQAVLDALGSSSLAPKLASFPPLSEPPCDRSVIGSDGFTTFAVVGGELVSRDLLTGDVVEHGPAPHGPAPAECVRWVGDETLDRKVAWTEDEGRFWAGPFDGPFDAERTFDARTTGILSSFRPTGRWYVVSFPEGAPHEVSLVDDRTLATVGEPVTGGGDFVSAEFKDDGSLFALGFSIPDRPEGDGELVVVDGVNGSEQLRLAIPVPVGELIFDESVSQLVGATFDGRLITIDLESGEIVADVGLSATAGVDEMEIGDDGLVTVISAGQLEVVDRMTGPVGEPVELRDVFDARVRPDGLLLSIEPGGTTSVISLDSTSLVVRSHEIDPFARTTLRNGLAASASPPELVDLASGERSPLVFVTPDGAPYVPFTVLPDPDALWTYGADGAVTRWEDGSPVASVDVPGLAFAQSWLGDRWVIMTWDLGTDGTEVAHVVGLNPQGPTIELSISVPDMSSAHPSPEGGLYAVTFDGVMSVFDADGEQVNEIETGLREVGPIAVDTASGRVALASPLDGAAIVDSATGEVRQLAGFDAVANLGFAQDGRFLALTNADGTVRLWDVERDASAGLVWDGTGARGGEPSWYDEDGDSVWVTTSGKIIEIPLDSAVWLERACEVVGRDLTQQEWDRLVPGDATRQSACGREIVDEVEPVFAIETMIDFESEPRMGTFEVTLGTDELGCSAGSVVDSEGPDGITNEFACESGPREGTFTFQWQIVEGIDGPGDVNGPWTVIEATGDFAGLTGEGLWSLTLDDFIGRFSGVIAFDS